MEDKIEIKVRKWGKEEEIETNWREIIGIYTEMRRELIKNCKKCEEPKDEFDAGKYCEEHEKFEKIDNIMAEIFIP